MGKYFCFLQRINELKGNTSGVSQPLYKYQNIFHLAYIPIAIQHIENKPRLPKKQLV